jgi:hypothetical protein
MDEGNEKFTKNFGQKTLWVDTTWKTYACTDGNIIPKLILENRVGRYGLDLSG